jgi:hypothetical protein
MNGNQVRADFSELAKTWKRPFVKRKDVGEFSGGILHPRTMANLDSKGEGPAGRIRLGGKVAYPVKSLISWMEKRDKIKKMKTLHNSDISEARKNVADLNVVGNGDMFKLLSKASSKSEGWMKSTKALEIHDVGCVVQVTTQQGDNVAEALVFVPGVEIVEDPDGTRRLFKI